MHITYTRIVLGSTASAFDMLVRSCIYGGSQADRHD